MNDRKQEIEAIFHAAAELDSPEQREIYLNRACGGDARLRSEVETLLRAVQRADQFFDDPALARSSLSSSTILVNEGAPAGSVNLTESPGTVIGRYKLLQRIGEGGCGVVYMAEQEEPVRRRVALKVIKLGMDTKSVIARFEAERQALAMMDHPSIARVLDGGATEAGRPYFVMELVQGVPITEFCDKNKLSARERLQLFIQVCHAIQSAHQKGVIHRDIKPSNVLVTLHHGEPMPKVIDFGIAKATNQKLTEKTLFTNYATMIGTPAYMSPEQAEMSSMDVDTRTDVYALGVLLYELLTGTTPFPEKRLRSLGYGEMQRVIIDEEPERPSTRLSTMANEQKTAVARNRGEELASLSKLLKGDLDWVVMKCLEKDRRRRYDTPNELVADLHRHLGQEPVVARPPSASYRFQKLVRRNKLAFTAASAVMVALTLGFGVSTWLFFKERSAYRQAVNAEREKTALFEKATKAQANEAKERKASERRLYDSLLSEARLKRKEHRVGFRDEIFGILKQAHALDVPQKDLAELRTEAVAAMGDGAGFTPITITNFPIDRIRETHIDPTGQTAGFRLIDGTILLRKLRSGEEIDRLKVESDLPAWGFCFNAAGDQIVYLRRDSGAQNLDSSHVYVWDRGADGHWREKQNFVLPGARQIFTSAKGVFGVIYEFKSQSFELVDLNTTNVILRGNLPPESSGALSPDGRFCASVWIQRQTNNFFFIDLWDLETGKDIKHWQTGFKEKDNPPPHLTFSPDGKHLAVSSTSMGEIYSLGDFERVAEFQGTEFQGSFKPSFSPRGTVIALPTQGQQLVRLWDWVRKEDITVLQEPEEAREATFSPDGNFLLTSGRWSARLYPWPLQSERLSLPKPADSALGSPIAFFSSDSARILSVEDGSTVKLLDAATGSVVWELEDIHGLAGPFGNVAYGPSGLIVTPSSSSTQMSVWDEHTKKRLLKLGTNKPGFSVFAQFTRDGRYLVTMAYKDINESGKSIPRQQLRIDDLSLEFNVWTLKRRGSGDALDVQLVKTMELTDPSFTWLALSPDNRHLAFSVPDFTSHTSHPSSGLPTRLLYIWELDGVAPHRLLTTNVSGAFTPDGRRFLTFGTNREVITLDVATGATVEPPIPTQPVNRPQKPEVAPPTLTLSPDGTRLTIVSGDNVSVEIWNWNTHRLLYSLPKQEGHLSLIKWSPDSQRLAVGHAENATAIWNLTEVEQTLAKLGLNP